MSTKVALRKPHKRGDTFRLQWTYKDSTGALVDLTGWTLRAQLRDAAGTLVYTFAPTNVSLGVTRTEAPAATTATWAPGAYEMDLEYRDPSGFVQSTSTVVVSIVEDVTQ